MRIVFLLLLAILAGQSHAQNGYVKYVDGSVKTGFYLKRYFSAIDGRNLIELWETRKDKKPIKIFLNEIDEYAVKRDTVIVLHDFKPFKTSDYTLVNEEGQIITKGRIDLLKIGNIKPKRDAALSSALTAAGFLLTGGKTGPTAITSHIYVLYDQATKQTVTLPRKKEALQIALLEMISEDFLNRYTQKNGEVRYSNLSALIAEFNKEQKAIVKN